MKAELLAAFLTLSVVVSAAAPSEDGNGYRSPEMLVVDPDGVHLYVTEVTAGRVAVIDGLEKTVVAEISVPGTPRGLALDGKAGMLYVTCARAGTPRGCVAVVNTARRKVVRTFAAGHSPCAPVLSPDGKRLYLCDRFANAVALFDAASGKERARIRAFREPVACALTPDGKQLFVANLLPDGAADADSVAAEVTVIDAPAFEITGYVSLPNGSTELRGICASPDGRHVFVTHILARYHMPTTQLERGWMNTNALSIIDAAGELINTVMLDDVDLGAANPFGVVCTPDGHEIVVAHSGSHVLSFIDAPGLVRKLADLDEADVDDVPNDLTFILGLRRRVALPGRGPRGVAALGKRVFVAEYFSDSIGVVEHRDGADREPARTKSIVQSIPLGPKKLPLTAQRRGEMLFHDATICFQEWQSCSSCHPDGRADGLNWDLLNDGFGNPKNTKSMLLAHRTPPAMAMGARGDAEAAVRAGLRHILFTVRPEEEAAAIDVYLTALKPVPSPYLDAQGGLSASALRGREIFVTSGCARCHSGNLFTDLEGYDLKMTAGMDAGSKMDCPTLIEVWRTAPYLFDGRAATMDAVLTDHNLDDCHGRTQILTPEELQDLTTYVLSL